MLSRKEKFILKILNDTSNKSSSCLITPKRLTKTPSGNKNLSESELDKILQGLEDQNYLDVVKTTRLNEEIYCITLYQKGKNYLMENERTMRALKYKILLAVVGAFVSFIAGRLLFILF